MSIVSIKLVMAVEEMSEAVVNYVLTNFFMFISSFLNLFFTNYLSRWLVYFK